MSGQIKSTACLNAYCKGQSSWQTTESRRVQSHVAQSSGQPVHPLQGRQKQNLDMPSQRMGTILFPRNRSSVHNLNLKNETNVLTTQLTKYINLHNISNLLPLIRSWVTASWIVGASMEYYNGALWSVLEVLQHTFEVNTPRFRIPVPILTRFREASIAENKAMVF